MPAHMGAKEGERMTNSLERLEWQKRCAFNGFCKNVLRCAASSHRRDAERRRLKEVPFSELTQEETARLFTNDRYFDEETEPEYCVGGKKITAKLIAEALRTLPDEKRKAVLLYYFFDMTDVEIGELLNIPRSTVQYRRTSSLELLKNFLEGRADEYDE